ncbi:MAG TPA: class I SAM-dependent methyltransferase [Kofleriaceae bacterium]|jgi:23S rRNA (cytosine1962-C5)-methyltransferase|nr:class I SAM-dependent methyltransferase [Kofleriaceae bacterium]
MSAPRRYQLRKEAVGIVRNHPWVFRDQLSTAATVFTDGDWLRLVDGANQVVGYGIYEAEGAIAIRVLRRGPARPDAAWLRETLAASLAKRAELAGRTDGLRLVHGESDGIPAVVVDRFGDTLVVQSYARGADALARFAARAVARELAVRNVMLRPAHRRRAAPPKGGAKVDAPEPPRVLAGAPPDVAHFTEDGVRFAVDLAGGQKSGAFLDLRALRRAIATTDLAGARVLNLFAFSGMLGYAAELAGAAHVTNVDASERALAFAAAHHARDAAKHAYVTADIFKWLPALPAGEPYDLVIVDPPSMTSHKAQVPSVLAAYKKLYRAAAPHVRPGGILVAACCTSRIERAVFHRTVAGALGSDFTRERELPPEPDHPVGFPQADYLKIGWWRRR